MSNMRAMKKKNVVFIILLLFFSAHAKYGTFFRPRSITFDSTFELALSNYHIYYTPWCDDYVALEVKPFYQQSLKKHSLAAFFLPDKKPCISVKQNGTGDVGSVWLGLASSSPNSFDSTLKLKPKRKSFGAYINIFIDLWKIKPGLWANIGSAAISVKHTLGLTETNRANRSSSLQGINTVIEALNNPDWLFGQFDTCVLKKSGLDDIQVKLGYNWYYCDMETDHIGIYLVGGIPTGRRVNNVVFEPLVGSNHGNIGVGSNNAYSIQHYDHNFIFMSDLKYQYILSAEELRFFDLCPNGKWSRYMLLTRSVSPSIPEPAINDLALPAKVTPGSCFQLWVAAHYNVIECDYDEQCDCGEWDCVEQWWPFSFEVGYNFWVRQHEKVIPSLFCCSCNQAIFDITGAQDGHPVSASKAKICQSDVGPNQAPSDLIFTPITMDDLNQDTAGHPTTSSSKIYGAFSYDDQICGHSFLLGLGASYEFAHNNAALEQYAVWLNMDIKF